MFSNMVETEEFGSVLEDTDTILENREVESFSHDFDEVRLTA